MGVPGRISTVSSIVAAVCIILYVAAITFGAVQIIVNLGERKNLAEAEFNDLADRASSSAVFLGFMSDPYKETIRDFLNASKTLTGIIISGPNGQYAFEREPGSIIAMAGNSPRFKSVTGVPMQPFYMPLRIDGQRNVNIQAVFSRLDYSLFQRVLRNSLLTVLAALAVALITLLMELSLKKRSGFVKKAAPAHTVKRPVEKPVHEPAAEVPVVEETAFADTDQGEDRPQGLYTSRGNIGWESYIHDRLSSELHRCASFEQDLTLIAMGFRESETLDDDLYRVFADEAVSFFSMRDLIFEKGENGITVIAPSTDLDQGLAKSEEFRSRMISKFPASFEGRNALCIGLSSRSGRLIEADRLIREAFTALDKALEDPSSAVIAFKSDPEKYRKFIKEHS